MQQQSANIFTESPNSYNLQSISESDKVKKSTILSDSELAAQLKQTENNLINLSKVLGFVTLSNGSQSNRNSVVSQVNNINNNNKNVTSPKPQPHHHQQASSVVRIFSYFVLFLYFKDRQLLFKKISKYSAKPRQFYLKLSLDIDI